MMSINDKFCRVFNIDSVLANTIIEYSKFYKLNKNSYLLYQDEEHNFIAFIISGILGFHSTNEPQSETYYNLITQGSVLNETQLIMGGTMGTEVKAISDCQIAIMTFEDAHNLLRKNIRFSNLLNLSLAKKNQAYHSLFLIQREKNAKKKIIMALNTLNSYLSNQFIPVNNITLASMLGISRNTVGKCINQLIESGEVVKANGGYRLLK